MSRSITRWVGVALAVFALVLPIQAQNVLTIRVESFEALLDDVDTIAVALGQPKGSADGWLQMAQSAMGMPELDWIDKKNPVVLALPLEGMMLGQNGFVGAFPVADVDAAVAAMKSSVEGVEIDENGLIHVPAGDAETLFFPSNGYLVFGRNPNLIGGFDPAGLLAGAHLPPGTIAAEFNVDSMRAMIGMAVEGARQKLAAGIAEGAQASGEGLDSETVTAVTDTMIGWIQTLVANTRSIQIAFEVTDSHLIVHNHYVPVSGSTLEGFLRAQEGGMPDIARLLDDSNAAMALVGNVTMTDEMLAAFEGFMQDYVGLISTTLANNSELAEFGDLAAVFPAMMERYSSLMKCMRGDLAQVVDMSDGIAFSQVSGIRNTEECSDVNQQVLEMASEIPEGLAQLLSVSEGWTHRGVKALEYGIDPSTFLSMSDEEGADEALQVINAMFGEDGFKTYLAASDGYWITSGGAGAEKSFKTLIDRVKDKKKGSGIDEAAFEPFDVGAGLYMMMDFGRLVGGLGSWLPEGSADSGELAQVQEIFNALGAMTGGIDLQRDSLGIKFAMPTAGFSTIAELAQRQRVEASDDDSNGDHDHGDHDGEGHDHGHEDGGDDD
jgi:hypothetical protein